jgi:hypothetical protein
MGLGKQEGRLESDFSRYNIGKVKKKHELVEQLGRCESWGVLREPALTDVLVCSDCKNIIV